MGLMHNAIKKITKIPHTFKFYGEAFAVRIGGGGKFHNFAIFFILYHFFVPLFTIATRIGYSCSAQSYMGTPHLAGAKYDQVKISQRSRSR